MTAEVAHPSHDLDVIDSRGPRFQPDGEPGSLMMVVMTVWRRLP
jgi:hypothetical protein